MNLLLSRHGNTFGPNDKIVWAGATNDLPLVEKGFAQAERLAETLRAQQIRPAAVYCSPLRRTGDYAQVLVNKLELSFRPIVDSRLMEIDYGEWTGRSNEEIAAQYGPEIVRAWDEHSQWPTQGSWGASEVIIKNEVQTFTKQLIQEYAPDQTVIVVTSNGRLRFFLTLIEGELERRKQTGSFKVKTGNICKLRYKNDFFHLDYWNVEPNPQSPL